jgi:hypothetical protein
LLLISGVARRGSNVTDREKGLVETQDEEIVVSDDFVREDARRIPGEEIDPDSVRPVPPVDEEGEIILPLIDEDDLEHAGQR